MVSLFNRVRSASKNITNQNQDHSTPLPPVPSNYDEFGRVSGASSLAPQFSTPQPKVKEKLSKRTRTISAPGLPKDLPPPPVESTIPDGTFLPLYVPGKSEFGEQTREYGYLGTEVDVVLELQDVQRLVASVGDEITSRALDTPLLFSSQALDVSSSRVRSLVRSFLATCHRPSAPTGNVKWKDELVLAAPHELGMILRWGLARIVRTSGGQEVRGFIDWDLYLHWRELEESLRFPATHFEKFLDIIPPITKPLTEAVFKLFSRFAAYSASSGLTPTTTSSLFGPLIFGLGLPSLPFSQTYAHYLRSSHAVEHLLLSYIRTIEVETRTTAVGMPSRLKTWIRGYPIMIPPTKDLEKPRRGSKLINIATFRRNVRIYSQDLVKDAAGWATEGGLSSRAEWMRVSPRNLPPKYSDAYRKRLDVPHSFSPSLPSLESSVSSFELSRQPTSSTTSSAISPSETTGFRSLTDFKWGEFEALGFGNSDKTKLEFDLTEGARNARTEKRNTMSWNDFSSSGFTRTDTDANFPLSTTLQFSLPVSNSIQQWPAHSEDIHRKLKKTQKSLPAFGWDTTPVPGMEWIIEEGFADCWADLLLSSGWMDKEERTFREANWAMVEFAAVPQRQDDEGISPVQETRSSSQWFLFEEFVPREYRDSLTRPPKKRGTFFSPIGNKSKAWKPSATLNGKPYTGRPRSPNPREVEFDALLRATGNGGESKTKLITLSGRRSDTIPPAIPGRSSVLPDDVTHPPNVPIPRPHKSKSTGNTRFDNIGEFQQTTSSGSPQPRGPVPNFFNESGPSTPSKDKSRTLFKLPGSAQKQFPRGSEYDPDIDFETRTASDSSGELGTAINLKPKVFPMSLRHNRRQSKDDAWVDILVADNRRLAEQEATFPRAGGSTSTVRATGAGELRTPKSSLSKSKSDPELAREELSKRMSSRPSEERGRYAAADSDDDGSLRAKPVSSHHFQVSDYMEDTTQSFSALTMSHPVSHPPVIHIRSPSESSSVAGLPYDYEPQLFPVIPSVSTRPRQPSEADDDSDFQPIPQSQITPIQTPPRSQTNGISKDVPKRSTEIPQKPPPTDKLPSPPISVVPDQEPQPSPRKPVPAVRSSAGGVSSLIEMYGKKDAAAAASRIPVRSQGTSASPTSPQSNSPPRSISPSPSPTPIPTPLPPVPEPLERAVSPARYVHGAPLHNVMEEESEEEV